MLTDVQFCAVPPCSTHTQGPYLQLPHRGMYVAYWVQTAREQPAPSTAHKEPDMRNACTGTEYLEQTVSLPVPTIAEIQDLARDIRECRENFGDADRDQDEAVAESAADLIVRLAGIIGE